MPNKQTILDAEEEGIQLLVDVLKAYKTMPVMPLLKYFFGILVKIDGELRWAVATCLLFGQLMAPYIFGGMHKCAIKRICPLLAYSDDWKFEIALCSKDGKDVAKNATHVIYELTMMGIPINQKLHVSGSPLHLLGLIVNL